jgi:hypothetical protein
MERHVSETLDQQPASINISDIPTTQVRGFRSPDEEMFAYRPVPMLVPIAMFLAVSSSMSFFGAFGVVVSVIALFTSILAYRMIVTSKGAYTGKTTALIAIMLSLVLGISGTSFIYYQYSTEVPSGHERISFYYDISQPGLKTEFGEVIVPKRVQKLKDKTIFLKGYMYPQRQISNIKQFLLLKDTGECCFGGKPKPTDMILVKIGGDQGVNHFELMRVSVGGKFNIKPDKTEDGLEPIYQIDADYFSLSKTQF